MKGGSDEFETIARHVRVEIPKIKGSRFIADALPAQSEDDAKTLIARIAHEFPDATHHCFAYSVNAREIERSSDAGEPGGTAGPPILRQIKGAGLTNLLVVVTRYYGGTNLGKGGLIRAYGSAAKAVLTECRRVTQTITIRLRIQFAYADTSPAMRTIEAFDGQIVDSSYDAESSLLVAVAASKVDDFESAFKDALGGRGSVEPE